LRPCIGVVLAGLTARAGVGVGGLEEAIQRLEDAHTGEHTSYRFAVRDGEILAQVERGASPGTAGGAEWRTLVELAS